MRCLSALLLALCATVLLATPAAATPVANSDSEYALFGRIFPDPMGGCGPAGIQPCSPFAQGNVPATQFIGLQEFIDGITYLNSKPEWQRYVEVWPLDGRKDENDGDAPPAATPAEAFPGNNLPSFEFTPKTEYKSVGLATTSRDRQRSDLYVVRVTDETVPDDQKQKYALSLSIHGIERAGAEGGTRAIEDLVTSFTPGTGRAGGDSLKANDPIVPDGTLPNAPTFGDVLKKMIIYFTYPNPDGWRRGSVSQGGVFFQRYNGNGVDLNRDWPDVGFSFRPYSTGSEPEVRGLGSALQEIGERQKFDAGVDLHGQLTADALSYTLIGHGRHDWAKDTRIRTTARNIHVVSEAALAWSPIVVPNDTPRDRLGCVDTGIATACANIYGQTWGTVYDTINYTVTGALGDWLDSPFGLNADGIDNEMSFSHLDRNIIFEPQGEQLHVDGNKALIYAQITSMLNPPDQEFTAPGLKGYVGNTRKKRAAAELQDEPPRGTVAQAPITGQEGEPGPGGVVFPFPVKNGKQPADDSPDAGKTIFNGGLRVDITKLNFQGISDGSAQTVLKVQCKGCDDHPGIDPDADGFITVAEDFNQSPGYAQGGLTVAVNRPQTKNREGGAVEWRALLESDIPTLIDAGATMNVEFMQGPATLSRDTSGFNPPRLAGYDVANTDFFRDVNANISDESRKFHEIDPRAVAAGRQSLRSFTSIVLSDQVPRNGDFLDALQDWVRGGGNLVLTDSSLRLLPEYFDYDPKRIAARDQYVGQISFQREDGADTPDAIEDPLLTAPFDVRQQGARFNSGLRRQVYEPTPLGFAIQHAEPTDDASVGDDDFQSPAWDIDRAAFERAGGRTAATAVTDTPDGVSVDLTRTTVGEVTVGEGRVRFIGAVLPQPSQEFDHDFGIEPYSLTYTGHLLLRNALEWPARPIVGDDARTGGAGAGSQLNELVCPPRNGMRSVAARGVGRRKLRITFRRNVRQPVNVDVFQESRGRRVLRERLVARFRGQSAGFTWNGRANRRGRRVRDGYYMVRYTMPLGGGFVERRRVVLQRINGRFRRRAPHHRRENCGLLTSFKLERPVFGGTGNHPLRVAFRIARASRVTVDVLHRGRRVGRSRLGLRQPRRTYRLRFRATGRPRGTYRVRITVRPRGGSRRVRAVLTSRLL